MLASSFLLLSLYLPIITIVLLKITMSILLKKPKCPFMAKWQSWDLNPNLLGRITQEKTVHSNTDPEDDQR